MHCSISRCQIIPSSDGGGAGGGGLSACKGIHLWCYVRGYLRHHMTPERFLVLSDKQMSGYTVSEANFVLLYINHLPLSLYR